MQTRKKTGSPASIPPPSRPAVEFTIAAANGCSKRPKRIPALPRPGVGCALPGWKILFQLSQIGWSNQSVILGRDRHETRRRHCGNHEARGDRNPLRLSGQPSHRICRQCRHPPGDGAPGTHRRSHGGRDLARHIGPVDRRLLHAARSRRGECDGRRGAMLRRIRARPGAADGLCAPARQYRPELQFQPGDEGVFEVFRADQHRR